MCSAHLANVVMVIGQTVGRAWGGAHEACLTASVSRSVRTGLG